MISLKRLIMRPGSPDRAIEQAFSESEAGLARIAHVNRATRDIMDVKYYECDLSLEETVRVQSKKLIIKVKGVPSTSSNFEIQLRSTEFTTTNEVGDFDKFYFQMSAYQPQQSDLGLTIVLRNISDGYADFEVNRDAASTEEWLDPIVYIEILKLDN